MALTLVWGSFYCLLSGLSTSRYFVAEATIVQLLRMTVNSSHYEKEPTHWFIEWLVLHDL